MASSRDSNPGRSAAVMSKKTWKDHLLSSGVPLEHSVIRILERLEVRPCEYKYERINTEGLATIFSVDVYASDVDAKRNSWLELFVECKYRHDGTYWVFTPSSYNSFFGPTFRDVFVLLDAFDTERQIDTHLLNSFAEHYPLSSKAIELLPDGSNPKTIKQAINQLRYAVINKTLDGIVHQVEELLGSPTPIFVLVPIVVTTAQLWRLNPDVSIEDIRKAANLKDIATLLDLVVLHEEPDNLAKQHTKQLIGRGLNSEQKKKFELALRKTKKQSFDFYLDVFSSCYPSLFVIVNYLKFEEAMQNLPRFFRRDDFIKLRPDAT